ncbi:hypothetical protein [Streptomyces sioyaensis]|uniref:hypothetical protein n=1 Tax=Streptomyces sioyaensis TaxID=67364 RepID=UPI003D756C9A
MHRPYPNRDRARHQLARHSHTTSPRTLTPAQEHLAQGIRAIAENLRRAQPTGMPLATALAWKRQPA